MSVLMITNLAFVIAYSIIVFIRVARINSYGAGAILVQFILDFFFAVPVLLDLIFGIPDYTWFPVLYETSRDPVVRGIYSVIIIAMAAILLFATSGVRNPMMHQIRLGKSAIQMLFLAALAPIIAVLVSGNLQYYITYGAVVVDSGGVSIIAHNAIVVFILVSIVASGILYLASSRPAYALLMLAPIALFDVWVAGKRAYVAFFLLILVLKFILEKSGRLRIAHLAGGVAVIIIALSASSLYQQSIRQSGHVSVVNEYDGARMDFGRDHILRIAIASEIDERRAPILDYRGQTAISVGTFFVPRSVWPDKPWPFHVYLTSAAVGQRLPGDLGWGLTTDIFSEAVANVSWAGLPLALILVIAMVRSLQNATSHAEVLLGTLSLCALIILEFQAVWIFHALYLSIIAARRIFGWNDRSFGRPRVDRRTRVGG